MKTKVMSVFAALVLAAGAPCVVSAASMPNASDEAAIKKCVADFSAAWNKHDPKAMAATWAEDADLINPFGRAARGRAEIEKLFTDEQSMAMKGTTYTVLDTNVRMLSPDIALCELSGQIANMKDPSGTPMPLFKHHVVLIAMKRNGTWWPTIVRPYVYLSAPAMPTSG
jgi:uncharacterized protein (TIGR02246 family)